MRVAAERVTPAVVDIHTAGREINVPPPPFLNDPFLRHFFGIPSPDDSQPEEQVVPRRAGSGVIISREGYILTNAHVVDDAERVQVGLGGRDYPAQVVGKDDVADIAVVKIDPAGERLPVARLGNSDDVQVGDWAIAVGDPLDVGTSVTLGIISAVHRRVDAEGHPLQSLIQTDAAINPGNSGGPLADSAGRVIGINESIASPTGANIGIGFAIPINAARAIAEQLIRNGKVG